METITNEEYILYKTSAQGTYINSIRQEIRNILKDIVDTCFQTSLFTQTQTWDVIHYISSTYKDELEFLWKTTPKNAIWRRKDTNKWYGVILTIPKNKLRLDSEDMVEILDLRISSDEIDTLLAQDGFYPGWHMNKKHWFTVILDGSISNQKLFQYIQNSYNLAK